MRDRKHIEQILRDDLEKARARYRVSTELFTEIFDSIPSGIPGTDGVKRIEIVAGERRRSMEGLANAVRRWSDFLVHDAIPPDLEDGTEPNDFHRPGGTPPRRPN